MSAILDQIKRNALPAAVLRTAAKGALPLPGPEMIEILVYLTHNPIFAHDAKMTLAAWDLQSAKKAISSPDAPAEVIGYYWSEQNRRPSLMPTLIENSAITDNMLMELAGEATRDIISILLASPRVRSLPGVIEALSTNPRVLPAELQALHGEPPLNVPEQVTANQAVHAVQQNTSAEVRGPEDQGPEDHQSSEVAPETPTAPTVKEFEVIAPFAAKGAIDPELEAVMRAWEKQYAAEIAAAESEPFELVGPDEELALTAGESPSASESVATEVPATDVRDADVREEEAAAAPAIEASDPSGPALAIAALSLHQKAEAINARKLTIMQRIGKMKAAERIKTAFIGGKEERAILIRDRARIIQNAVLASPKLTDAEVELFASARNLDENVLREIGRSRRFMKNYPVVRNLATNPKTPLDVAMPLVKMLLIFDLKQLQRSKSVPEIIRKMAQKYYQEKAISGGKTKS